MKSFKEIRENKLADITDSIRGHIGLIGPNSTVTSQEKSKAAKNVSKDHNISLNAASKFVDDYCRMKREETELGESNPFKHADDVIRKVRNKAVVANLKGDKLTEEKYSKRLTKVLDYRNKMLANESFESDKQLLDHHVTNNEPTLSNVNKMHDMVRNISKTHGVSSDKIYNQVVDNSSAHNKYREAASS